LIKKHIKLLESKYKRPKVNSNLDGIPTTATEEILEGKERTPL
jgi:hypothetical protein